MTTKTPKTLLKKDTTNLVFTAFMNDITEAFCDDYTKAFGFDVGSKFIRVFADRGSQKSAYCFVDRETGDIYKTASWGKPALNCPRGNVYDGMNRFLSYGLQKYGAYYLR